MSRIRVIGVLTASAVVVGLVSMERNRALAQAFPAVQGAAASLSVSRDALTMLPAHCDTLDGPVVSAAKRALDTRNPNLVLIWVQPKDESELRSVFQETLEVRKLGSPAKTLADRNLFETLVRLHRAGEGAPYTGLKAKGTAVEPAVAAADNALSTDSVEPLVRALTREVELGLRRHFTEVQRAKRYAPNDVAAGRKFVAAYVEYVHYAEAVEASAKSPAHGHYPEANLDE